MPNDNITYVIVNLSNFEIITTIIGLILNLVIAFGVVAAFWQIYITKGVSEKENLRKSSEKAISLAKIFADEIIFEAGFIKNVYKEIGIFKILDDNIGLQNAQDFTVEELNTIFTKSQQIQISEALRGITITHLNKSAANSLGHKLEIEICKSEVDAKKLQAVNEINAFQSFYTRKMNLLNRLEWFCMHFNSGVANPDAVFQSLHVEMLRAIKCLYYDISMYNDGHVADKLFTNIIDLYCDWNEKTAKLKETEKKEKRRITKGLISSTIKLSQK